MWRKNTPLQIQQLGAITTQSVWPSPGAGLIASTHQHAKSTHRAPRKSKLPEPAFHPQHCQRRQHLHAAGKRNLGSRGQSHLLTQGVHLNRWQSSIEVFLMLRRVSWPLQLPDRLSSDRKLRIPLLGVSRRSPRNTGLQGLQRMRTEQLACQAAACAARGAIPRGKQEDAPFVEPENDI